MLWLYRWLRGLLTVEIVADIPENLLNLCAKNGVMIWGVRRVKGRIRCRMGIRDFKSLPKLLRGNGVRVHILQKSGFPFLAGRYRRRYGIAAGAVLFFALLKVMSLFIWSVEVEGNQKVDTADILAACSQIGICEGKIRDGTDYKIAGQQLLLKTPELSWCAMNLEGCRLTVNVSESDDDDFEKSPSDLKAKADGTITKIDVQSGNCLVKVGDTVAKGDLLVSGVLEPGGDFVHSSGSITAKTVRQMSVCVPLTQTIITPTGKHAKKRVLSFFGFQIPLYLGKTGGTYRSRQHIFEARLFGAKLPLAICEKTFYFTRNTQIRLTEEKAREEAEKLLLDRIETEEMKEVIIKNREFSQEGETLTLRAFVTANEEIAAQEKLLFNTGN